jgi:hypothetical protein
MGNQITTPKLTATLATEHRVVMLGGLAVISHGHSRPTFDADIWLDPSLPIDAWSKAVYSLKDAFPELRFIEIGAWQEIQEDRFNSVIERDGVFRAMGASQPLNIFRAPNELPMEEFEEVWSRATRLDDGTRLPDVIDLLVTKQETGRDKDTQDIAFLEAKAEREYLEKLPGAPEEEAAAMLERFLTPPVAQLALQHPGQKVRTMALQFIREMADEGNPYARDILDSLSQSPSAIK